MDKKQNRSVQAPTKGVGTESKKNQDVATGKFWPRGGRKRESTGNNISSKNEPTRKPVPQRNKSLDKRPKPRGGYYAPTTSGKENTGVVEYDAELGSVFVPGSKKQSLNHLLNFHYTPRGNNDCNPSDRSGSNSHRLFSTQKHKYNKEQFLQANCQFVVNSVGDYKLYMNNPDALVDWELVEQIHVQVSEFPSCPICLYPPVAAKMTRCGHVYCWSCILHYLTLSDKSWRKCPICYESVSNIDLKSVIAMPHNAFNVGEYISLRLMKRAQGSLTVIPVEEANIKRNSLLNLSETKVNTVYSKLLLANSAEVMSIINREGIELQNQLKDEDNCAEKLFIEQAIQQLQEREKLVFSKLCKNDKIKTQTIGNVDDHCIIDTIDNNMQSTNDDSSKNDDCSVASKSAYNNNDNVKYYYFYQATDGQHIYLHPVNIRMLEYAYGSLEHCPTSLNGRIVEKEGGSMTEDIRRRLRYLQHIPVTCQFEVAEIQLRPPIVTKETLDYFQDQLETRKKRRQRRAKDEKRREKRIEAEENKRLGRLPEVNLHIDSFYQFPQFSDTNPALGTSSISETPTSERNSSPSFSESVSSEVQSPSLTDSVPSETQYAGPSFAKMLATGKSKPDSWPGLRSSPYQNTISNRSESVANVAVKKSTPGIGHSDSESELDGYVPAPAYNQSFSDAIALALEKASINETDKNGEACSGGKKKKKNKQKVLFATSMVYSGK